VDGTDPYIIELITPQGYEGYITYQVYRRLLCLAMRKRYLLQQYTNQYYGHFFNYTRLANPHALIWSRPVDGYPIAFNITVRVVAQYRQYRLYLTRLMQAFLEFSPKCVAI
jgi:hypothetical protein